MKHLSIAQQNEYIEDEDKKEEVEVEDEEKGGNLTGFPSFNLSG